MKTIEEFERIDILYLNAGISSHFLFKDMGEDFTVFEDLMQTNFFGYLYPTR